MICEWTGGVRWSLASKLSELRLLHTCSCKCANVCSACRVLTTLNHAQGLSHTCKYQTHINGMLTNSVLRLYIYELRRQAGVTRAQCGRPSTELSAAGLWWCMSGRPSECLQNLLGESNKRSVAKRTLAVTYTRRNARKSIRWSQCRR